ncbi:MAG TPA: DUF4062 domain-containing protein [Nitrososphaera sp.]|jgi:muconolactone delta-isomerase|nr:DUF4062 domain-containing protein [Nitrososphaera sp.]
MKKKLQIFISSTYSDLIEERQAAVSSILKAGHIPAGMELFTSGDESQMETIKRWIGESDIFMLILGGRYGSIEPNTSLSYTELEYDYAVKSGKPFFAVVIEEGALEQKVKRYGSSVLEIENAAKLDAFRKKVLSRTTAFFKDVQDIRLAVYETISEFLIRHDFKGWVSGDEIPDIQSFTDQINKLREENKKLAEDKNALSKGEFFTPSEEREFDHIRGKLDRDITLHYDLHDTKDGTSGSKIAEEVYKTNLLSAITNFAGTGHHRFQKSSIEYFLYEKLNEIYSQAEENELKRGPSFGSITDNLSLEILTYGLASFIEVDRYDHSDSLCAFTEKMYRFAYWLDYNGYIPEIHFNLVSKTEVEAPPPESKIPQLSTIKEIDRTLNFKARRNRWRTTEESVKAAEKEFESLCEELEHKIEVSNKESEAFKIDFIRNDNQCEMSGVGISLLITWSCKDPNAITDSVLSVVGNKTRFDVDEIQSFPAQEKFYEKELDIDISRDLKVVWRRRGEGNNYILTNSLADDLLAKLLRTIQERVTQNR